MAAPEGLPSGGDPQSAKAPPADALSPRTAGTADGPAPVGTFSHGAFVFQGGAAPAPQQGLIAYIPLPVAQRLGMGPRKPRTPYYIGLAVAMLLSLGMSLEWAGTFGGGMGSFFVILFFPLTLGLTLPACLIRTHIYTTLWWTIRQRPDVWGKNGPRTFRSCMAVFVVVEPIGLLLATYGVSQVQTIFGLSFMLIDSLVAFPLVAITGVILYVWLQERRGQPLAGRRGEPVPASAWLAASLIVAYTAALVVALSDFAVHRPIDPFDDFGDPWRDPFQAMLVLSVYTLVAWAMFSAPVLAGAHAWWRERKRGKPWVWNGPTGMTVLTGWASLVLGLCGGWILALGGPADPFRPVGTVLLPAFLFWGAASIQTMSPFVVWARERAVPFIRSHAGLRVLAAQILTTALGIAVAVRFANEGSNSAAFYLLIAYLGGGLSLLIWWTSWRIRAEADVNPGVPRFWAEARVRMLIGSLIASLILFFVVGIAFSSFVSFEFAILLLVLFWVGGSGLMAYLWHDFRRRVTTGRWVPPAARPTAAPPSDPGEEGDPAGEQPATEGDRDTFRLPFMTGSRPVVPLQRGPALAIALVVVALLSSQLALWSLADPWWTVTVQAEDPAIAAPFSPVTGSFTMNYRVNGYSGSSLFDDPGLVDGYPPAYQAWLGTGPLFLAFQVLILAGAGLLATVPILLGLVRLRKMPARGLPIVAILGLVLIALPAVAFQLLLPATGYEPVITRVAEDFLLQEACDPTFQPLVASLGSGLSGRADLPADFVIGRPPADPVPICHVRWAPGPGYGTASAAALLGFVVVLLAAFVRAPVPGAVPPAPQPFLSDEMVAVTMPAPGSSPGGLPVPFGAVPGGMPFGSGYGPPGASPAGAAPLMPVPASFSPVPGGTLAPPGAGGFPGGFPPFPTGGGVPPGVPLPRPADDLPPAYGYDMSEESEDGEV